MVLLVSVLIAMLSSAFILLTFHYQGIEQNANLDRKLRANSSSGIEYLLTGAVGQGSEVIDLFGNGEDSVMLKSHAWGIYQQITSIAIHGSKQVSLNHLAGGLVLNRGMALYLSNSNKELGVSGKTMISGDVIVPQKGISRAYVEGKTYSGSKLFYGSKTTSTGELPVLADIQLKAVNSYFNGTFSFDKKIDFDDLPKEYSFSKDTVYLLYSNGKINLDKSFKGKLIIQSEQEIIVASSFNTDNCILVAPHVYFKNGFKGAIQVFASDSIITDRGVSLQFPSVFAVRSQENAAKIVLGENSSLYGSLLALQESFRLKNNSMISIQKGCDVRGQIYASGYLELKRVEIKGSVYANKLLLKTKSSVYENLLMDVKISPQKLDRLYAGLLFVESDGLVLLK
jgi:hypothetical protein